MAIEDGLDVFGEPLIALPADPGGGQSVSAPASPDADRPAFASVEDRFRRDEPFEEGLLTRGSDNIAVGQLYVGDTVPPNSFRRVYQQYSMRSVAAIEGHPKVRFWGDSMAVIEEGLGQIAPGPQGDTSVQRAFETLDGLQEIVRPTMSIQTSVYQIRFRVPGYDVPGDFVGHSRSVEAGDIMCIDETRPGGQRLAMANKIETFPFGNSGSWIKEFLLDYPTGDTVPIVFDIVNHNPVYAIQAAFSVFVLIDRS